jgi:putative membrane protein
MWTSALVASLHYIGLGIGLGAIYGRAQAFQQLAQGHDRMKLVLQADNWWGISALLLMVSGFLRAFGGLEKGAAFYLASPLFHGKMLLFLMVGLLEIMPMIRLIRWRMGRLKAPFPAHLAVRYARFSYAELGLLLMLIVCATLMARGG